jgi:hypothetical protein
MSIDPPSLCVYPVRHANEHICRSSGNALNPSVSGDVAGRRAGSQPAFLIEREPPQCRNDNSREIPLTNRNIEPFRRPLENPDNPDRGPDPDRNIQFYDLLMELQGELGS